MKNTESNVIFSIVAEQNNVTPETVREEIAKAIRASFDNPDPNIQARLRLMFPNGVPDPEKFMSAVADLIRNSFMDS